MGSSLVMHGLQSATATGEHSSLCCGQLLHAPGSPGSSIKSSCTTGSAVMLDLGSTSQQPCLSPYAVSQCCIRLSYESGWNEKRLKRDTHSSILYVRTWQCIEPTCRGICRCKDHDPLGSSWVQKCWQCAAEHTDDCCRRQCVTWLLAWRWAASCNVEQVLLHQRDPVLH